MRMIGIKMHISNSIHYTDVVACTTTESLFRLLPTLVDFIASTPGVTIDNSDDIRRLPFYSEAR
jgi:hypothetical protein